MNENPYHPPESTDRVVPGNTVTVQISEIWVRRLNSPLFVVVGALTGVSISFAPLECVDNQLRRGMFPDDLLCAHVLHAAGWAGDWAIGQQKKCLMKSGPANE